MIDVAASVIPSAGLVCVVPSGSRKTTLSAAWSANTALPSGVAAEMVVPVTGEDRLDLVDRGERDELLAGELPDPHRAAIDDERAAVDGVHRHVLAAELHAGRVGDPPDAGVDDGDGALRAVVDGDDPGGLVDVVVAAGVGDADRRGHLADDAVDVADEAAVALEQPRTAVVGLRLGALTPLCLQRGDDDGAEHEAEHDENAAGDAAARALGHASHSTSSFTAASTLSSVHLGGATRRDDLVGVPSADDALSHDPPVRVSPRLSTGRRRCDGDQSPRTPLLRSLPLLTVPRDADPAVPPVQIDGFDELRPIGRGGFSYVFSARQRDFNRRVALKVLTFGLADERERRSFERECRAMGLVSQHPHIVTVFNAAFTTTKQPCIVMELYSGGTLGERLKRDGPLPVAVVLDVGVKIAGALQTAHDRGLLHRDIKPQNLFVSEFGEPALGDFGISTLDDERSISGGGGLTVHYAPPEVLEGAPATARSDVYSFAATLYTLLEGSRPFAAPAGSQAVGGRPGAADRARGPAPRPPA